MCGISGVFSLEGASLQSGIIERMTCSTNHRGPDATGYYKTDEIALGHNRLSIIDLSEIANQPIADVSKRYFIVFNGEIYNYKEVKSKLSAYPYKSTGDTEVILAAFIEWGPKCLDYLNGMFAFAIWDNELNQLFIARDRFGVKPLYYSNAGGFFLFASEIRSILSTGMVPRKVNAMSVSEYLQFESVGDSNTIIENIFSLEAGYYMTVSKNKQEKFKYWSLVDDQPHFNYNDKASVKRKIRQLLNTSIQRRMVSDVPIGAFLSGGIDSSAIVGLMAEQSDRPINTFTLGFNEKEFDESPYAEIIAKKFNTNHTKLLLEPDSFLNELIPALDAMDTPTGDGVNSYVVSKTIRKTGITVALSGVGGDELFAGYPIFFQYLKLMRLKPFWKMSSIGRKAVSSILKNNARSKSNRYGEILSARDMSIESFYPSFRQILSKEMISGFTTLDAQNIHYLSSDFINNKTKIAGLPLLSQVSVAEYSGYTRNTLLKDMDQMSMAVSLEVREPFFDHELVKFVLHVPDNIKVDDYPKSLLVESLEEMLPTEIVHRKKQGFLFPWSEWMKNDLRNFCDKYINDISKREFINGNAVIKRWNEFLNNDPSIRWKEIWVFVVLEYWLQKNEVE